MTVVYVDTIIFDLQRAGGISVYWYEMIKRLLADNDVEPYFIVSDAKKENIYWDKLSLPQDRVIRYNKFLNRYRAVNYKEQRKHIFISSYYRFSKNKNAVNMTVVHDFTYEYFSSGLRKFVHHWQKMKAIYKSDKVICISENTQNDLNKFAGRKVDSVVVYNGVSDIYRVMTKDEIDRAVSSLDTKVSEVVKSGKYVLFVGQRAGYKNWKTAVAMFKQLPDEYSMISVGGGELSEDERNLLGNDINRHYKLSALSEDQLCVLYNQAYCLLYLSEYEGFGLPVAEAEQCGCPVIALNKSSIPEVASENSILLSEYPSAMSDMNIARHKPGENRFTWDNTYSEIKSLFTL